MQGIQFDGKKVLQNKQLYMLWFISLQNYYIYIELQINQFAIPKQYSPIPKIKQCYWISVLEY